MSEVLNIAAVHREGLPALQIGLRTTAFDIIRDTEVNHIQFIDVVTKESIPLEGYITEAAFANALKKYPTIDAVNQAFSQVYSRQQVDNAITSLSNSVFQKLSGYYNKTQVENMVPTVTAETRAPTSSDTGKPGDLWVVYE